MTNHLNQMHSVYIVNTKFNSELKRVAENDFINHSVFSAVAVVLVSLCF